MSGSGSFVDTPKGVELLERAKLRREVLQLRLHKWSYADISERVGVGIATLRQWVREETVASLPQEEAEELRAHEAAGLDEDERRANWVLSLLAQEGERLQSEGKPVMGVLEEIRQWQEHRLKLRAARSRLLGLDKPIVVEHNLKIRTSFDEEVESLTAALAGGGNLMSLPEDVDLPDH